MAEIPKGKEIFLAIDANAIIHRAYHAYPANLTNSEGTQLNAVYGFASMLLSVLNEFDPKYILCAFDTPKPTFRHTAFPEYKAHRKPIERDLTDQFPLVEELLNAFNIPIIKKEGFEADDILGDLSKKVLDGRWKEYSLNMIILSGDRDLLQLVGENVFVCLPNGNFRNLVMYDVAQTVEKMGVKPEQIIDLKAMVGDQSDNIPGVKGIGDKSAVDLLTRYGSVDGIYEHLNEIKPRQATLLAEGVEQMEMSRSLATIEREIGIKVDLGSCATKDFDRSTVIDLFNRFEFRSLLSKIPSQPEDKSVQFGQLDLFGVGGGETGSLQDSNGSKGPSSSMENSKAGNADLLSDDVMQAQKNGVNFQDTSAEEFAEVAREAKLEDKIYLYYFSYENSKSAELLKLRADGESGTLFFELVDNLGVKKSGKVGLVRETVQYVEMSFTSIALRETYTIDWESLAHDIAELGGNPSLPEENKMIDLLLAAHMLSSGQSDREFDGVIYKYLGIDIPAVVSIEQIPSQFQYLPLLSERISQDLRDRSVEKVVNENLVEELHERHLKISEGSEDNSTIENNWEKDLFRILFTKYEMQLTSVLSEMEVRGVKVDLKLLKEIEEDIKKLVEQTKEAIFESVGHEFNVNSPVQLGSVLFDELGLPSGRGKSGRSTREEVLQKFVNLHPAISEVLKYREISKLLNTYVTPLVQMLEVGGNGVNEGDAKRSTAGEEKGVASSEQKGFASGKEKGLTTVHTNFLQCGASSGRLSSQNPNMQNLPVKGDMADRLRSIFIARDEFKLVSFDYSQIELRILANLSEDPLLVRDFVRGEDVHSTTASRILDKPLKGITDKERRLGKTINFGILYGQTRYGLSSMLGISVDDAQKYIDEYFEKYPGVREYIEGAQKKALSSGYVESMLGRRRYVSGLDSRNQNLRNAAIREAINMPLQGSAADIMKLAMVEIYRHVKENCPEDVYFLLQIHDEVIFEMREDKVEELRPILEEKFKSVVKLNVPLVVHSSVGENLSEL